MKRDAIGFDRDIELAWLEATSARVAEGMSPAKVREFLWELLAGKVSGDAPRSGRGKTTTVLLHIWCEVPAQTLPLRNDCLEALAHLSGEQQLMAHWTMSMATYPFFVEVVSAVGRLLALQETVTLAQITRRIAEKWGERSTAVRACRRVVRSIVRWGALRDTDRHGVYARRSVPIPATPAGVELLVEGLLRGTGADAGPLEGLTSSPALFPFRVSLADSWGSGSGRLELTREGVDRDVVVLAPHPRITRNRAAWDFVPGDRGKGPFDTGRPRATLLYGLLPEESGGDGTLSTLVDETAALHAIRAGECRTWGEYLKLAAKSWAQAQEECGKWLNDLNDGRPPGPETPFSFREIYGATLYQGDAAYWISRWIKQPREAALERLTALGRRVMALVRRAGLEISYGSPMGHIECIDGTSPSSFETLASLLRDDGWSSLDLRRDDHLVARCLLL